MNNKVVRAIHNKKKNDQSSFQYQDYLLERISLDFKRIEKSNLESELKKINEEKLLDIAFSYVERQLEINYEEKNHLRRKKNIDELKTNVSLKLNEIEKEFQQQDARIIREEFFHLQDEIKKCKFL